MKEKITELSRPLIALFDAAVGTAPELLVLRMTVLIVLLRGYGGDYAQFFDVILTAIGLLMLISERALLSARAWWALVIVMLLVIVDQWYVIDNHKYLFTYWTMACALAVSSGKPREILGRNGRLLIALVFVFAMFWKLAAGELIDGSFFHATFLTDERFRGLGMLVGDMPRGDFLMNARLLRVLEEYPGAEVSVGLVTTTRLWLFALFSSWWVLVIEALLALTFCLPMVSALDRRRDLVLLLFIGTTYVVAPVDVFAMLLAVMGFAQCAPERIGCRRAYLIAFVLLPFARLVPGFYSLIELLA